MFRQNVIAGLRRNDGLNFAAHQVLACKDIPHESSP
ncbi:MAG: hypothetical protein H6R18_1707 [Proteobacteria bacterium]|nr:hypothetical protein [Pseudomonadota bacterium]